MLGKNEESFTFDRKKFFENLLKNILDEYSKQSFFTSKDLTNETHDSLELCARKYFPSMKWDNYLDHHYMNVEYEIDKRGSFLIDALILSPNISVINTSMKSGGLTVSLNLPKDINSFYKFDRLNTNIDNFINWISGSQQRAKMYSILIEHFLKCYKELENGKKFGDIDYPLTEKDKKELDRIYTDIVYKFETKFMSEMNQNLKNNVVERLIDISKYKVKLETFTKEDLEELRKKVNIFKYKTESNLIHNGSIIDDSFKIYVNFLNELEEKKLLYLHMAAIEKKEIYEEFMFEMVSLVKDKTELQILDFINPNSLKDSIIEKEHSILVSKAKLSIFDIYEIFSQKNLRENFYPIFKDSEIFSKFSCSVKNMGEGVENYYNINWKFNNTVDENMKKNFSNKMKEFFKDLFFNVNISEFEKEHQANVAKSLRELHLQMSFNLKDTENSINKNRNMKRKI